MNLISVFRHTLLLFIIFYASNVAGINCNKAVTSVEIKICSNEELMEADKELEKVYLRIRKFLIHEDFEPIKQSQIRWIKNRDAKCSDDINCLNYVIKKRTDYLNSLDLSPKKGSRKLWEWDGSIASIFFKNGISLFVLFSAKENCDLAYFGLSGNSNVKSISFNIDSKKFISTYPNTTYVNNEPIAFFPISNSALSSLKKGEKLLIKTNEGNLVSSLSGTAYAFNMAYDNCIQEVNNLSTLTTTTNPNKTPNIVSTKKPVNKKIYVGRDEDLVYVKFKGRFEAGDGKQIIDSLDSNQAALLILDSEGGLVKEAQIVAYYLRSNNIKTLVSGLCASACVFALSGGVERFVTVDSKVGVHRSSLTNTHPGDFELGQKFVGNDIRFFKSMGVDPEIVAISSNISSDAIKYLDNETMYSIKLITRKPEYN